MISQHPLRSSAATLPMTASIANDALLRIPTGHFHGIVWARNVIATCMTLVGRALVGERDDTATFVRESAEDPHTASIVCVLSAVCDAIVADAFRTKQDVRSVTSAVSSFESAMYTEIAALRERKDTTLMNDSDTAELAAGLVRVVKMHDEDTAVHLDATAALARRIAVAMDLPRDTVTTIELAGRLHDIGKVSVPKEILCKPGPLDAHEWQTMRLHAEAGAAVLADTPRLARLAPIVRAHHERLDGYGYPDRLRGPEIPIEARVVAVADAFHAMTTERPYHKAMLPNEALEILAEHSGTQFDSAVVEATFELFRYIRKSRRAIA